MAKRGNNDGPNLFDHAEGKRLRDLGIAKVTSYPNDEWVANAKRIAVHLAKLNGTVTSDDVQRLLPRPPDIHPNATGGICRCPELRMVGTKSSERTKARARRIGIYAYVDQAEF